MIKRPERPETIMPLTKVSTNKHTLTKLKTLYKTDTSTQDMPQNEINCVQTVKLISVHFESVWLFCNVLQFCPVNSRKKVHNF